MQSLNSQKENSSDKEIGDLRRKIDQIDRQLNESKRNLEKSNFNRRYPGFWSINRGKACQWKRLVGSDP